MNDTFSCIMNQFLHSLKPITYEEQWVVLAPFPGVEVDLPHSDSALGLTIAASLSSASRMKPSEDPAFLSSFYVTTFFFH